jgi:hypothetical protein
MGHKWGHILNSELCKSKCGFISIPTLLYLQFKLRHHLLICQDQRSNPRPPLARAKELSRHTIDLNHLIIDLRLSLFIFKYCPQNWQAQTSQYFNNVPYFSVNYVVRNVGNCLPGTSSHNKTSNKPKFQFQEKYEPVSNFPPISPISKKKLDKGFYHAYTN